MIEFYAVLPLSFTASNKLGKKKTWKGSFETKRGKPYLLSEYNFSHLELCLVCLIFLVITISSCHLSWCFVLLSSQTLKVKVCSDWYSIFSIHFLIWYDAHQFLFLYGRRCNTLKQGEMHEKLISFKQKYWPLWDKYDSNPYCVFGSNAWR